MKLYRVDVTYTFVMTAEDEDEEHVIAALRDGAESKEPETISHTEITKLKDLPYGWEGKSLPWGEQPNGGEKTIQEILEDMEQEQKTKACPTCRGKGWVRDNHNCPDCVEDNTEEDYPEEETEVVSRFCNRCRKLHTLEEVVCRFCQESLIPVVKPIGMPAASEVPYLGECDHVAPRLDAPVEKATRRTIVTPGESQPRCPKCGGIGRIEMGDEVFWVRCESCSYSPQGDNSTLSNYTSEQAWQEWEMVRRECP
jgi:hypothetical protein